jgi:hypothetical protein
VPEPVEGPPPAWRQRDGQVERVESPCSERGQDADRLKVKVEYDEMEWLRRPGSSHWRSLPGDHHGAVAREVAELV